MSEPEDRYQTLVDASCLHQHLNDPDWIVLDARFNLADTEAGRKAYRQVHIPGAHYVHLDQQLSSPITSETGRHPLPDPAKLGAWFASIGLSRKTQVVVYDDMGGAMAARCWWLLRTFGHETVAVLDGGFPQWQKSGLVTSTLPTQPHPGDFVAVFDDLQIVNVDSVVENLDSQTFTLVDARTAERYRGEQEPLDLVAGHVPGALNRPLAHNLSSDGCFKPAEQLRLEWLQVIGQWQPQQIVHMCGSGVTACHNQLAMEIAGLSGSRVYAGSWSEWIRDSLRPVAQG